LAAFGREDHPDLLLGRPLVFTEFCQTVGTVGDFVLGNWSQYLEGTYQPMQSAESMHVRFVNHERTFKFWTRNAGQPWWKAALTPAKSTTTLSPFVTLATRA
jgi:HK97 family phage major capsid protein